MEIGGPMTSLYLFGNPDHYASNFFTVYWKTTFEKFSSPGNQKKICKKLFLKNQFKKEQKGKLQDFQLQMTIYMLFESKALYEWIQISTRCKKQKSQRKKNLSSEDEIEDKPQPKHKKKIQSKKKKN